ncbi:MAG: glutaredoxin family protein [Porticoccaceae bacterium]|nr:glutaredoxin family protein [Porticoccaceae bacterium]
MANSDTQAVLTLYTGEGCHLCGLARDILEEVLGMSGAGAYEVVSITGDDTLMAAYGERIPVVKNIGGQEKGWPFTAGQVRRML